MIALQKWIEIWVPWSS